MRHRSERGSALLTVVVIIVVLIGLSAVYVGNSVSIGDKNLRDENRYKARLAAISGLNRALAELDESVTGSCKHVPVGLPTPSCFGNIDGSVNDCRVLPASSPVVSAVANPDACSLDANTVGGDGWPDFKDESLATPGVALLPTAPDGTYTVRCKGIGAPTGANGPTSTYSAYHLRAYGVCKHEVVGLDVIAQRETLPSINVAMYGKISITGSGQVTTNSFKSGSPPDPGTVYAGTIPYVAGNPSSGHGDIATQGNLTLSGQSQINGNAAFAGTYNGGGTVTGAQTNAVPPPPTIVAPTPSNPTNISANVDRLSGQNSYSLGSAASPVSGDYTTDALSTSGQAKIAIYPASGQTVRIFVQGNNPNGIPPSSGSVSSSGQQSLQIFQPTGNPLPLPGIVQIVVTGPNPSIQLSGQAVDDTLAGSSPAAMQFIALGAGSVQISGQGQLDGMLLTPNSSAHFSGQAGLKGMVIADTIDVSGQASFDYDLSLANLGQSTTPIYRVFAIIEVAARSH